MRFSPFSKVLGALLLMGAQAQARTVTTCSCLNQEGPAPQLDPLLAALNAEVITASRVPQGSRDAPATVVIVTEDQIRQRGYRSLLEVLQHLPDFKTEKGVHEHYYSNFAVRGAVGPDKFIIMMDGVRITGPTNEPMPILENYPVHLAKQIEVVYGPASALYGADAVAGIVNIITRAPEHALEATFQGGQDGQRFGNVFYAQQLSPSVHLRFAGQFLVDDQPRLDGLYPDYRGFQAQQSGIFPSIFGHQTPSLPWDSNPSHPLKASATHVSLKIENLQLFFFSNQSRFPSFLKNTPDNAIYNREQFIGHRLQVLGATHVFQEGNFEITSKGSYARFDLNPNSNYRDVFGNFDRAYKYAHSSAMRLDESAIFRFGHRGLLGVGINFESFDAVPWSADLVQPVDPDGDIKGHLLGASDIEADFFRLSYQNLGVYLHSELHPKDQLSLTLGLRLDHNSRYGGTLNPRMGLVYRPSDVWTFKGLYGTAFLAPSPYEAYLHYGAWPNYWRLPNPNLKPIKSETLEISAQCVLGLNWSTILNLYQMKLRNTFAVVSDSDYTHLYNGTYKGLPVGYIEVQTNLGTQVNTGGSLQVNYAWTSGSSSLNAYLTASYVDGRVDRVGDGKRIDIGGIAPWQFKAGAEWVRDSWTVAPQLLWITSQRVGKFADPATGQYYHLPGYRVLNLHAGKEWRTGAGKVSLILGVTNALDARYRNLNYEATPNPADQSAAFFGVPQDSRRITLAFSYRQ